MHAHALLLALAPRIGWASTNRPGRIAHAGKLGIKRQGGRNCVQHPDSSRGQVRALANDPAVIAEVEQDIQAGRNANVSSTPTLILTHRSRQYRIPGGASYEVLRRFLDQLLAN
jgi:hypothetical protein